MALPLALDFDQPKADAPGATQVGSLSVGIARLFRHRGILPRAGAGKCGFPAQRRSATAAGVATAGKQVVPTHNWKPSVGVFG